MATHRQLKALDEAIARFDYARLAEDIRLGRVQYPTAGCNGCRFANPEDWDRICTLSDISLDDWRIGIMGGNCSRRKPLVLEEQDTPAPQTAATESERPELVLA
jgi:hypothetical protein